MPRFFALMAFILLGGALLSLIFIQINPFNLFGYKPTTSTYSSAAVITQIRKLSRLETAQFTIETIIEAGGKDERFGGILFGDKLLLIANGRVVSGVDLTTITERDIEIENSNLNITLPPSQIFSVKLDNTKTRVYDRQKGLLSKSEKDLESTARLAAEGKIRQAACEGGILIEASTNAKEQLEALFSTLGFTSVTVTVPVGEC